MTINFVRWKFISLCRANHQLPIANNIMYSIAHTLMLLLSISGMASANDSSDSYMSREKRIIGGQGAEDGRYPYAVSLKDDRGWHVCGGSLIAKDTVLTAAHCLGGYVTTIVVGDDGLDIGEHIAVDHEVVHPDYDSGVDNYDIGLIFLKESISSDIPLLALNDDSSVPDSGTTVFVMGWGDTDPGKLVRDMPDELMIVELQVISNENCEAAESGEDSYKDSIFDDMLCTESQGEDEADACQGDSGGPLIVPGDVPEGDVQVGVVSWGIGCAFLPGVFSRVSSSYDWIKETVCDSSNDPPGSLCGDVMELARIEMQ